MRSDVVKKGAPAAPNRSLLYALGYTREELERPLIGVVCSYNEIVPGHMNLDKIAEAVKAGVRAAGGTPMLMICGLYQLFGEYFETVDGSRLDGIGVIGAYTVGQEVRMIGNLTEHSADFGDIIGYENHSGQTFLREGVQPLGTVDADSTGNNGEDHTEGARVNNVIGTYMHGSLLPKNPAIADFLIRTAAERRYGSFDPAAAGQTEAQRAELDRINTIASNARRVAMSRPR